MTVVTKATPEASVGVFSTAAATPSVDVWAVKPIWVSPKEVIATPRIDGNTEPQY
jgi:hypothetical protein